jgi:hypothetical protein
MGSLVYPYRSIITAMAYLANMCRSVNTAMGNCDEGRGSFPESGKLYFSSLQCRNQLPTSYVMGTGICFARGNMTKAYS